MELIDEPLSDAELHSLIRVADADNNGKIDYEGEWWLLTPSPIHKSESKHWEEI